jgi:hypothetical protein
MREVSNLEFSTGRLFYEVAWRCLNSGCGKGDEMCSRTTCILGNKRELNKRELKEKNTHKRTYRTHSNTAQQQNLQSATINLSPYALYSKL